MGSLGPTVRVSMAKADGAVAAAAPAAAGGGGQQPTERKEAGTEGVAAARGGMFSCGFQMPLHYPRYKKADYEAMPEWRVDGLLREYGLPVAGDLDAKRSFAMGAFLWPDQY